MSFLVKLAFKTFFSILLIAIFLTLVAKCALAQPITQDIIKLSRPEAEVVKTDINNILTEEEATLQERTIVLAIASIETDAFKVDYPLGDNKLNDAYNISIYKMNIGLLKKLGIKRDSINEIHTNPEYATKIILQGIRYYGITLYLIQHRGGEGALDCTVPIQEITSYIDAITSIAMQYAFYPEDMFNDTRYTIDINPI